MSDAAGNSRKPGSPPPPAAAARKPPVMAVVAAPPPPPPPVPDTASSGKVASAGSSEAGKLCPTCFARYPDDFNVCPKDATKLELSAGDSDPLVGAVLGSTYQIIRILGEGGMGRVYEARHLRLKSRRFAVKVLHAEYARHGDVLTRFQREAEAAAAINHAHVLEVFDVHRTDDNRPFIVGEFLEGEDFHEYLEEHRKLDVPTAVAITRQTAGALKAAHEAGIVHRDLKPENLYVVTNQQVIGRPDVPFVKILDFGISKVQGAETNLTRTGMIMGTPNYMAPEQARGEKVDQRCDIYALGAILYRMVTGKRAFEGTDPSAVITAVLSDEPKRPRDWDSSIPAAFEVLIQRAMAKDARDRYQSMEEFDRALAVFDSGPTSMPPPDPGVTIAPIAGGEASADEHARTYMGGNSPMPAANAVVSPRAHDRRKEMDSLEAAGRDARLARPTIVVLTPIIAAWILFVIVAAAAGVIRALLNREVSDSEVLLMAAFSGAAGITPLILWIVHVAKHVWKNSVRAMERAGDMRRFLVGSLAAYGFFALAIRFIYTVSMRYSLGTLSGWWDLMFLLVALVGGAFAGGIGPLARLRRRLLNT